MHRRLRKIAMQFDVTLQQISPSLPDDELTALVDLARTTFSNTFRHYKESDLTAYLDKELSREALSAELCDPDNTFYYVLLNGRKTGYIKWVFPGKKYLEYVKLPAERPLLLERIYFLPDYQGCGLAPVALTFALSVARYQLKADYAYLSVWDKNYRAQRFYQRHGFVTLSSFDYPVGEQLDHELLLGRSL